VDGIRYGYAKGVSPAKPFSLALAGNDFRAAFRSFVIWARRLQELRVSISLHGDYLV
jgi:hypothetical protein